jgi:ribosome-binding protein aMBF1 (putative translation factor)
MLIEKSIERVRAFRIASHLSVNAYAKRAGISEGAIRKMDMEGWSPNSETLRKLESVIPDGWSAEAAE